MALSLTPLALIDHLAGLTPPPRLHRHRYHGALAPNSPLRAAVTTYGRDTPEQNPPAEAVSAPTATTQRLQPSAHYLWAMLLARLLEPLPLVCPNCGADMPIIVFVPDVAPVARFLNNIGVRLNPLRSRRLYVERDPSSPPRSSAIQCPVCRI